VLVLARSEFDLKSRSHSRDFFAGLRPWPALYARLEEQIAGADSVASFRIRQFLDLLKEHDMNPGSPLTPTDSDTVLAFDQLARNHLKLLEDAVGRVRQEFVLKCTPNNRRLTGWYACSDRFQSEELQFFFYLMFPPLPDLVARCAVQVTKESSPRALAAASEHGFRKGRWGSLWFERVILSAARQVEELVRFFQAPLARLSKAGLVRLAPAHHADTAGDTERSLPGTCTVDSDASS
jgi:hypothetical protein